MISVAYAATDTVSGFSFSSLLQTPDIWLAVTFVLLMFIAIKPITKGFRVAMQIRGAKIKNKIISAKVLRADTEKLLQDYLKKQENVEEEIKAIIADAKKQAEQIRIESQEKLKEALVLREKQVMDNIALMETSALSEISAKVSDIALQASKKIIENSMDKDKDDRLISHFVSEMPATLSKVN